MNVNRILILGITAILTFSSCSASRYISKNDIREVRNAAIVSPFAYIYILEGGEYFYYDDSLSNECSRLIEEALKLSAIPTGKTIHVDLDSEDPQWRDAIASLRDVNPKQAACAPIPYLADRLLEENGQRYGILVFTNGFIREKKDYREKVALGVGLAVLTTIATGGAATAYSIPLKNSMHTWIAIIDSEKDCFVFLDNIETESDPTKPAHVSSHIRRLLNNIEK